MTSTTQSIVIAFTKFPRLSTSLKEFLANYHGTDQQSLELFHRIEYAILRVRLYYLLNVHHNLEGELEANTEGGTLESEWTNVYERLRAAREETIHLRSRRYSSRGRSASSSSVRSCDNPRVFGVPISQYLMDVLRHDDKIQDTVVLGAFQWSELFVQATFVGTLEPEMEDGKNKLHGYITDVPMGQIDTLSWLLGSSISGTLEDENLELKITSFVEGRVATASTSWTLRYIPELHGKDMTLSADGSIVTMVKSCPSNMQQLAVCALKLPPHLRHSQANIRIAPEPEPVSESEAEESHVEEAAMETTQENMDLISGLEDHTDDRMDTVASVESPMERTNDSDEGHMFDTIASAAGSTRASTASSVASSSDGTDASSSTYSSSGSDDSDDEDGGDNDGDTARSGASSSDPMGISGPDPETVAMLMEAGLTREEIMEQFLQETHREATNTMQVLGSLGHHRVVFPPPVAAAETPSTRSPYPPPSERQSGDESPSDDVDVDHDDMHHGSGSFFGTIVRALELAGNIDSFGTLVDASDTSGRSPAISIPVALLSQLAGQSRDSPARFLYPTRTSMGRRYRPSETRDSAPITRAPPRNLEDATPLDLAWAEAMGDPTPATWKAPTVRAEDTRTQPGFLGMDGSPGGSSDSSDSEEERLPTNGVPNAGRREDGNDHLVPFADMRRRHSSVGSRGRATDDGTDQKNVELLDSCALTKGRIVFDFRVESCTTGDTIRIGVVTRGAVLSSSPPGTDNRGWFLSSQERFHGSTAALYPTSNSGRFSVGDILSLEVDLDAGTLELFTNGLSSGIAFDNIRSVANNNAQAPFLSASMLEQQDRNTDEEEEGSVAPFPSGVLPAVGLSSMGDSVRIIGLRNGLHVRHYPGERAPAFALSSYWYKTVGHWEHGQQHGPSIILLRASRPPTRAEKHPANSSASSFMSDLRSLCSSIENNIASTIAESRGSENVPIPSKDYCSMADNSVEVSGYLVGHFNRGVAEGVFQWYTLPQGSTATVALATLPKSVRDHLKLTPQPKNAAGVHVSTVSNSSVLTEHFGEDMENVAYPGGYYELNDNLIQSRLPMDVVPSRMSQDDETQESSTAADVPQEQSLMDTADRSDVLIPTSLGLSRKRRTTQSRVIYTPFVSNVRATSSVPWVFAPSLTSSNSLDLSSDLMEVTMHRMGEHATSYGNIGYNTGIHVWEIEVSKCPYEPYDEQKFMSPLFFIGVGEREWVGNDTPSALPKHLPYVLPPIVGKSVTTVPGTESDVDLSPGSYVGYGLMRDGTVRTFYKSALANTTQTRGRRNLWREFGILNNNVVEQGTVAGAHLRPYGNTLITGPGRGYNVQDVTTWNKRGDKVVVVLDCVAGTLSFIKDSLLPLGWANRQVVTNLGVAFHHIRSTGPTGTTGSFDRPLHPIVGIARSQIGLSIRHRNWSSVHSLQDASQCLPYALQAGHLLYHLDERACSSTSPLSSSISSSSATGQVTRVAPVAEEKMEETIEQPSAHLPHLKLKGNGPKTALLRLENEFPEYLIKEAYYVYKGIMAIDAGEGIVPFATRATNATMFGDALFFDRSNKACRAFIDKHNGPEELRRLRGGDVVSWMPFPISESDSVKPTVYEILGVANNRLWGRRLLEVVDTGGAWHWSKIEVVLGFKDHAVTISPRNPHVVAEDEAEKRGGYKALPESMGAHVSYETFKSWATCSKWREIDDKFISRMVSQQALEKETEPECLALSLSARKHANPKNVLEYPWAFDWEGEKNDHLPPSAHSMPVGYVRARFALLLAIHARMAYLLPLLDMTQTRSRGIVTTDPTGLSFTSFLGARFARLRGLFFSRMKQRYWKIILDATLTPTISSDEINKWPRDIKDIVYDQYQAEKQIQHYEGFLGSVLKDDDDVADGTANSISPSSNDEDGIPRNQFARLESSAFGQLIRQTDSWSARAFARAFRMQDPQGIISPQEQSRAFLVKIIVRKVDPVTGKTKDHLSIVDEGGPYRAMVLLAASKEPALLGLIQPSPNNHVDESIKKGLFVFSPFLEESQMLETTAEATMATVAPRHNTVGVDEPLAKLSDPSVMVLGQYRFWGALVGMTMRQEILVPLPLSSIVWKSLVGLAVTHQDIDDVHAPLANAIRFLLEIAPGSTPSEMEDQTEFLQNAAIKTVEMLGNVAPPAAMKAAAVVTFDTRRIFVRYLRSIAVRNGNAATHIAAFYAGLSTVHATELFSIWEPEELSDLICGESTISVQALKRLAIIEDALLEEGDMRVPWLWEILESWSQELLTAFLEFVAERSRLPSSIEGLRLPLKIVPDDRLPVDSMPSSQTCFLELRLPKFSSKEEMEKKLLLALSSTTIDLA